MGKRVIRLPTSPHQVRCMPDALGRCTTVVTVHLARGGHSRATTNGQHLLRVLQRGTQRTRLALLKVQLGPQGQEFPLLLPGGRGGGT